MISLNGASCITDAYYNGTKLTAIYAKCGPGGTPTLVWPSQFTLERNDCMNSCVGSWCYDCWRSTTCWCYYHQGFECTLNTWKNLGCCGKYNGDRTLGNVFAYYIPSTSDYRVINHGSETITCWTYEWVSTPALTTTYKGYEYDECGDVTTECTLTKNGNQIYSDPKYLFGYWNCGEALWSDDWNTSRNRVMREYWCTPLGPNQAIYNNLSDGYNWYGWITTCATYLTTDELVNCWGLTDKCNGFYFCVYPAMNSLPTFRIIACTASGITYQSRVYTYGEDINSIVFTPR